MLIRYIAIFFDKFSVYCFKIIYFYILDAYSIVMEVRWARLHTHRHIKPEPFGPGLLW